MPDVQKPVDPRMAAMESIASQNKVRINEEHVKEGGTALFVDPVVPDEDHNADDAAAEAERTRLAAEAAEGDKGKPVKAEGEDDEQLRLQQEQQRTADEEAERARVAAADTTAKAQTAAGIDPAARLKLKVNGREMEMTGEEALRRLQKDAAGDAKLEEANRIMREAQELQQRLQQQEPKPAAKAKGDDGVVVDPSVSRKFTAALFKGDEEAATQAFNEAVSSAVKPPSEATKGRERRHPGGPAGDRRAGATANRNRERIGKSRADYPQLYADPDVEAVAASKISRCKVEGKPFADALETVQTEMATKFGWKKQCSPDVTRRLRIPTAARRDSCARSRWTKPPSGLSVKSGTTEEPRPACTTPSARWPRHAGRWSEGEPTLSIRIGVSHGRPNLGHQYARRLHVFGQPLQGAPLCRCSRSSSSVSSLT
jgi:hypothetical protein